MVPRPAALLVVALTAHVACASPRPEVPDEEEWTQSCGGVPEPGEVLASAPVGDCQVAALEIPEAPATLDQVAIAKAKHYGNVGVAYAHDPEGPQWAAALDAFRLAYTNSGSGPLLLWFAEAAHASERNGESIAAFERLQHDDVESPKFPAAYRDLTLAKLRERTAWLELRSNSPQWLVRDQRDAQTGPSRINEYGVDGCGIVLGLEPGTHVFQFASPQAGQWEEWQVTLQPGTRMRREVLFRH